MPNRFKPIGFLVDDALNILEFVGRTAPLVELAAGAATLHLPSLIQRRLKAPTLEALAEAMTSRLPAVRGGLTVYDETRIFTATVRAELVPDSQPQSWRILFDLTPTASASQTSQGTAPFAIGAADSEQRRLHFASLLRDQDRNHERTMAELIEAAHHHEVLAHDLEVAMEELRTNNTELLAAHQEVIDVNAALIESRGALHERLQFISKILDTVGALIVVVDLDGNIMEFNRACERVTGMRASEVRGTSVFQLIPPEQRGPVQGIRDQFLAGAPMMAHTNEWVHRNGERRTISWLNTMISSENGSPAYAIATGIDITDQLRAENALAASEAKFRTLIETAGESILCIDSAGRIVIANPAAEKLFGYEPGQLIEQPLNLLVPERHHAAHAVEHAAYFEAPRIRKMADGASIAGRRKDGAEVPLEISLSHFETDTGRLAVAFVQDVSERVASRRRLQLLARSVMTAQDAERSRIARDLHDDLTQSIALIGMKLSFVKQSLDKPREAILAELAEASRCVEQLAEEVRDLSHRLHPSVLEYSGLIPALESLVTDAGNRHGPQVRLSVGQCPTEIPPHVGAALYRVAQEALRNAKKHSNAKTVRLEITQENDFVHMTVSDDGVGFDSSQGHLGPGLGLISMEERVSDVRGKFTLRTSPGAGTTIDVAVPLAQSAAISASSSGSSAIR